MIIDQLSKAVLALHNLMLTGPSHLVVPYVLPYYNQDDLLYNLLGNEVRLTGLYCILHLILIVDGHHRITESQNYQGWERPTRSSSPTITDTSQLNHIPQHNIQMFLGHSHGR